LDSNRLFNLPYEIQLDIIDTDPEVYRIWPMLSIYAAKTTRFNEELNKHGKWVIQKRIEKNHTGVKLYERHGKKGGDYAEYITYDIIIQCYFNNGLLHGEYTSYYKKSGKLRDRHHYVNGKEQGEYTRWFRSGKIEEQRHYVNDKEDGVSSLWYKNGYLYQQRHYVNGKEEGEFKHWFDNGQLYLECKYNIDGLEGVFNSYHRNGQLNETRFYINGILQGETKLWYDNGILSAEGLYVNGELVNYTRH